MPNDRVIAIARRCTPGCVNRLAARHGSDVDVHVLAAEIDEWSARTGNVRNPDGLLTSWVTKAAREIAAQRLDRAAHESRQRTQHDGFWAAFLQTVAQSAPGPRAIADALEHHRAHGFPGISEGLIAALRRMGDHWPP